MSSPVPAEKSGTPEPAGGLKGETKPNGVAGLSMAEIDHSCGAALGALQSLGVDVSLVKD